MKRKIVIHHLNTFFIHFFYTVLKPRSRCISVTFYPSMTDMRGIIFQSKYESILFRKYFILYLYAILRKQICFIIFYSKTFGWLRYAWILNYTLLYKGLFFHVYS